MLCLNLHVTVKLQYYENEYAKEMLWIYYEIIQEVIKYVFNLEVFLRINIDH
jgi:hypothetical protein